MYPEKAIIWKGICTPVFLAALFTITKIWKSESHSVVSNSLQPHGLYSPWNSAGQNTGVGIHYLLQGIFPTQGLDPGLLHCRWSLYQLSHKESPRILELVSSVSSIAQSCPTLCDPMNRSTPDTNYEFTQTHVHRVSDAIQPSHPLSSPSPPAPNPSQHQVLFQWVNSLHEMAKVLEFSISPSNEHPWLVSFRMDWLNLLALQGTLKSSPTQQFKSINSSALSLLHSPTLTSIHDHWKNHSLD